MPSNKIKKNKQERRLQKQSLKRQKFLMQYDTDDICKDITAYIRAFDKAKKNVKWKPSIQKYELDLFKNIFRAYDSILNLNEDPLSFFIFQINERGKMRTIQSVNVNERVIQHLLCDEILEPVITKSIIYDNGASIKNKGLSFSINRLAYHLHNFYRLNNESNKGYILLIDFEKFFESLSHEQLHDMVNSLFTNEVIKTALNRIIDSFDCGLGLGCQVCQLLAIYYINGIDHYIKEALRIKWYGRYMDDSYFICKTKEECEELLNILIPLYNKIGIRINVKKTKIIDLSNESFIFLKKRFRLTNSGKLVIKQSKKASDRYKSKIRKFYELLQNGEIDLEYVKNTYQSYIGSNKKDTSYQHLMKIRNYVLLYFPELEYEI